MVAHKLVSSIGGGLVERPFLIRRETLWKGRDILHILGPDLSNLHCGQVIFPGFRVR